MNCNIAKLILWTITSSKKVPILKRLGEFKYCEKLSADEIRHKQKLLLMKILHHAYENSSYYKQIIDGKEIDLYHAPIEDVLKLVPTIDKQTLKSRKNDILTSKKVKGLHIAKTSGSTGVPLKFYRDKNALASTYAAMYRGHGWHGCDIGTMEARLWSVPADCFGNYKSRCVDFLLNRFRQNSMRATDETFVDFYQKMVKSKPAYLMGYPSLIYYFVLSAEKHNLNLKKLDLKFIKYTGETIHDYQKVKIEDSFGCKCASEYGSAESGVISFECPLGRHHIMADSVFVEFEDDKNSSEKKLIITNLHNYAFPIIRYQIGDIASPTMSKCECGVRLPTMNKVTGRVHDYIVGLDGKKYHSSVLSLMTKKMTGVDLAARKIVFLQKRKGELEVQVCEKSNSLGFDSELFCGYAKKAFENNMYVTVKIKDISAFNSSAKFRYFIPLKHNNL